MFDYTTLLPTLQTMSMVICLGARLCFFCAAVIIVPEVCWR